MTKKSNKLPESTKLMPRPPIVVVMGHIDHGKSTLIDQIRKSHLTEKEAGGITQHIGAYEIDHEGKRITFIDTPGHEAFSKMRSRGSKVADIAVLVVAAEDGVKEQTKEAIKHIKEAGIPFIVALNKIDKPGANPEKVKKELAENEVYVESYGGKVPSMEISAKTGDHVEELLDLIALAAEMEELTAEPDAPASGVVIEAHLDPRRGPVASLIIKNGMLSIGDYIAAGTVRGRVKILENDLGRSLKKASFSTPVRCGGLESVPQVGEEFFGHSQKDTLEDIMAEKTKTAPAEAAEKTTEKEKRLKIILKADVSGSLEALADQLDPLVYEDVGIEIVKREVGEINEKDVKLADALGGVIIGFRVKLPPVIQNFARDRKIEIISAEVIYDLLDKTKNLMKLAVSPKIQRTDLGQIKILGIFRTEKNRMIVGGKVIAGKLEKGAKIEVVRNGEIIGAGRPAGLKQAAKDVGEVKEGHEAGVLFEGDVKIEVGDVLNFYREEMRKINL